MRACVKVLIGRMRAASSVPVRVFFWTNSSKSQWRVLSPANQNSFVCVYPISAFEVLRTSVTAGDSLAPLSLARVSASLELFALL